MSVVAASLDRELVRALTPDLLAYFVRRLDDTEDAADAVGETLLVIWRRRGQLPQETEAARQYAFGIARNVLRSARRGRVRRHALADRLAEELAVALTEASVTPDPELRAALAQLAERDRELVLLVAWEGFGIAEAGAVLGLKPDAARQRYGRARARLRERLSASANLSHVRNAGGRVETRPSHGRG